MINAEVKWIDWVDDLPTDQSEPNMIAITAAIGSVGSDAADNFQVVVCNPEWVKQQVVSNAGIWPRGLLIVEVIDTEHVKLTLNALSQQFSSSTSWPEFTERMNRYLLWEFEDMNDYQGLAVVPPLR